MNDSIIIDQVAMERILYAIEESLQVASQSQFYSWAQGALQGLLPHETLLCRQGDFASSHAHWKTYSSFAEHQKMIKRLTAIDNGVMHSIVDVWQRAGCKPMALSSGKSDIRKERLVRKLESLGCGHALAHGATELSGREGCFFLFLQMHRAPDTRESYLLDLVMPHLYMALNRTLQTENREGSRKRREGGVLSEREEEVVRWVGQGKTNQEIGNILSISPLTVKNHVQKILRKLHVSNRAQAVFKISAISQLRKSSRTGTKAHTTQNSKELDEQRESD